ncbi:shikimate kinase [Candidatus Avoscillospira sp. LCP25S3_F1]|uniref:shikimate kinase n=1 Tax=Candidatus Avoscillospira sp. LCP25S3_F1 TaxID=3438825 RepID=UPI003F928C60
MNTLFLIGFMGAGKTSVSQALGQLLHRKVVEMDQCIAEQEGMSIPEIFAQKGEDYFRACETALLERFSNSEPCVVSCGGGVPMREENVAAMRRGGTVVLLTARPEVILERVRDDHNRPLLEGHKDVPYITALMEQRRPKYEAAADLIVDTSDRTIAEICQMVLQQTASSGSNH